MQISADENAAPRHAELVNEPLVKAYFVAALTYLFVSMLAGLLMAGGLYGFALWATARDPEMLRILLASSKARRRYDPGKHDRVDMEVASW